MVRLLVAAILSVWLAFPAAGASMVMMCVGNDDDVRAVALGPDGAVAAEAELMCTVRNTAADTKTPGSP